MVLGTVIAHISRGLRIKLNLHHKKSNKKVDWIFIWWSHQTEVLKMSVLQPVHFKCSDNRLWSLLILYQVSDLCWRTCFHAKCPLTWDWNQILFSCTGMFESADRCCREHDHCLHIIPAFTVNYGVFNSKFFTVSHCDCDQRWGSECTPRASDTESGFQVFTACRETPAISNSHLPLTCPHDTLRLVWTVKWG